MGRNKLKIGKLSTNAERQVTYSKRKTGIMKKAHELSILCDAEVLLLMFSTTGKASLRMGVKRKIESLDTLKKTFKKADHEVNVEELLEQASPQAEEIQAQLDNLKRQIDKTLGWLGPLGLLADLDNVNSLDQVSAIEQALENTINRNISEKENFALKLMNLQCNENGMNEPIDLYGQLTTPSMFPYYDNNCNQMAYPQSATFYPRDPRCSTSNNNNPQLANYNFSSNLGIGTYPINDSTIIDWPQPQLDGGIEPSIPQNQNGAPIIQQEHNGPNVSLPQQYPQSLAKYSNQIPQVETNFEYTCRQGETQNNCVPEMTYNSLTDLLQLPQSSMSDNEFVNSMFGQNMISFDSLEQNLGSSLDRNDGSNAVSNEANFQSWASGI